MTEKAADHHPRRAFLVVLLLFVGLISVALRSGSTAPGTSLSDPGEEPQRRVQRPRRTPTPRQPRINYSQFSHQTHVVNQKLECGSCHQAPSKNWNQVRKGDAAFPDVTDFPEHASCLDCHRAQFFARERPAPAICSNCHVAVTPRDTSRWLFPSLGDVTDPKLKRREAVAEFGVAFPHDLHLEVVGFKGFGRGRYSFVTVSLQEKKAEPPKSCPVCHETYQPQGNSSEEYVTKPPKTLGDDFWLKKGTFKTVPNSHTVCFTCHNEDSGIAPEPKDCSVCHKLVAPVQLKVDFDAKLAAAMGITDRLIMERWSSRISSAAFRHEGGEHPELNCLSCHNAATINTLDPKTTKVPVRSCGGADGCHITATTDDGGILNFEIDEKKKNPAFVCTKCHTVFGKQAFPETHPKAIPIATAK